jgi:hypothetical protein
LLSGAASVTAVGSFPRHVGGKAWAGEDRRHRVRRALGDDLAHEFFGAALDAFGADDHRRMGCEQRRKRLGRAAHGLRRHHQKNGIGACGFAQLAGQHDAVIKTHAGQEQTLAPARELRGIGGIMLPQRDLPPGARAGQRQRGAPGAGADDRDAIEMALREEPGWNDVTFRSSPRKRGPSPGFPLVAGMSGVSPA